MANTIRIKRRPSSGSAGAPSSASLYNGELAFNENDNILYYAYGSGVGGISTAVPAIAGSGAYALRGGTNATGTWPISINGNAAYATNAVYTTGTQAINGVKTFGNIVNVVATGDALSMMNIGGLNPQSNVVPGRLIIAKGDNDIGKIVLGCLNMNSDAVASFTNTQIELASSTSNNVTFLISPTGYYDSNILDYTGAVTSGYWRASTIQVDKGGTGKTSYSNGQLLIGSGTSLAANTLTQGDGVTITNGSGTIGIAVDSTVVRTTGTQSIGGAKTFGDGLTVGNNVGNFLAGTSGVRFTHPQINFQIDAGNLNPGFDGDALRLDIDSENGTGYVTTLKSNAPVQNITVRLPDTSGTLALDKRNMIAGSGLVGGGTISADRTFNIGQGDGITVSADSIAVDSTVVRTTGTQSINGAKSFLDSSNNYNIFSTVNDKFYVKAPNTNDSTYYFVGLDGGGSPPDANSAERSLVSRSTSQVKSDLSLNNVENLALSGITFTAGSGLVGGGTLAANRTFDINTGDGIQIVSDAVAVNSTVVRTTGTQTINGSKTFGNETTFTSGMIVSNQTANNLASFDASKKLASSYSVETTLTGGSSALPRADAVKTYVDNMIGSGIATNDAMIFKGTIDCSTNPNYPAADRGWVYKISVAGRIGGASGPVVEVNDTIICGTDGTAAGTHASVGSNWNILQTNIVDASILVTGPTSATSGNFAMFDGTTGKIVKDSSFSSSSFATAGHVHGNITNAGAIGSTANLPIITTTAGALTTGSFGSTANTFCQGNDSRLSDTRNTTNSITVNNGGAGDSSSFTFNGSAARTISYNSIGAPSISGTNATGTWGISINGNAGSVTSGVYTSGSYADPSWITSLAKSKVGLGNVENTALSTWAGSSNITTLGTIGTGTWNATTIAVNKGGTGQTSYVNGELLIGNSTGNTLTKATLTQGTAIDITNSTGSITIGHNDTSTLSGAQGSNGIASFTVDGMGHVTAVTTATYLTAGTVCAAIVDCTLDGGTF